MGHIGHVHVRYMYVWEGSVNGTCIGFLGNAAANLDNTAHWKETYESQHMYTYIL